MNSFDNRDLLYLSYEEGRNLIKNGDIAFIRDDKGIVPRIISFFTRSPYSHAGICFWATIEETPRLFVIEAQGKTKRRIVNLGYYKEKNIDIMTAPKPWKEYFSTALEKVGVKDYSWYGALYVGIREFLLKYLKIKLPYINFRGEICSEFIADVLEIHPRIISPQLLFEALQQSGNRIYIQIRT